MGFASEPIGRFASSARLKPTKDARRPPTIATTSPVCGVVTTTTPSSPCDALRADLSDQVGEGVVIADHQIDIGDASKRG